MPLKLLEGSACPVPDIPVNRPWIETTVHQVHLGRPHPEVRLAVRRKASTLFLELLVVSVGGKARPVVPTRERGPVALLHGAVQIVMHNESEHGIQLCILRVHHRLDHYPDVWIP